MRSSSSSQNPNLIRKVWHSWRATMGGPSAQSVSEAGRSFARRDELRRIQQEVQKRWEEAHIFEEDAVNPVDDPPQKFFGNFPYPYMNGALHLGHAFTISKVEFAAAYHRLCGRRVLFPFGFHCTGMPIKACADKLAREISEFGNPPVFPPDDLSDIANDLAAVSLPPSEVSTKVEPEKFKSKKSKVTAKKGKDKYQWEIMKSMDIPDSEIAKFSDASNWLTYFPHLAMTDLKTFGAGCDWRRSFITTEMNPFYDSFVRWQMRVIKGQGKVVKDRRYTIYSPFDGQPCADHDRASGEGVQPQEYTLIKMEVIPPLQGKLECLSGKRVFLAAATLRPETMYGQTNCWVLPDGHYGAFEINENGDIFVVTKRAARNLAYQGLSRIPEKPTCLVELTGNDLIGLPLRSPLTSNEVVYALPMLTILTDKGTGIVTSVPSDAPDDFIALQDLISKPALRAKYDVKDEWVLPYKIIPIIRIPEYGDKAAEKVCTDLKIKSQNDREKLEEAKKRTYLKGFTDGIMLVGPYQGMKVQEAKPLIKEMLIKSGQAVRYSEPERKVMSRSGDECLVALTDQWYLTYGESQWRAMAEDCLAKMEVYNDETRNGFQHTLGWLNQWACSRSFGLGTKLPWDEQYLIESLSDSTIYMAYYTVAHLLHGNDLYGQSRNGAAIRVEQMTDEVWDYIFRGGPLPGNTEIPLGLLEKMKQEFDFWYPFDVRVSGKDLIQNHLTFCIYNHVAMFGEEKWPKSIRCNGMLLLNSEKMSKSTGNFRTLRQAIEEFSADATRFGLADAGDTMDDANFVFDTANTAILRLTKEITWMKEVCAADAEGSLRKGPPLTFADRVFKNEIDIAIHVTKQHYDFMMFREALKTGFYDLQNARDEYRLSCGAGGMNSDLMKRFMDVQTRLLTPICPHYAEYVWKEILLNKGFAIKAGWPVSDAPDLTLQRANKYLQDTITSFRKLLQKQSSAGAKKGNKNVKASIEAKQVVALIFAAEKYDGWKEECLKVLQSKYNKDTKTFAPNPEILAALQSSPLVQMPDYNQIMKQCMPFIKFKKDEAITVGPHALDVKLPFDEVKVLKENADLIKRQLQLENLVISHFQGAETISKLGTYGTVLKQAAPSPGSPSAVFIPASEYSEEMRSEELEA